MGAGTTFTWLDNTTTTGTAGTLTEEQWQGFLEDWGNENKLRTVSTPYFSGWNIYDDIMKNKKEDKDMMGLYEVAIVNTKTKEFFCDKFIATSNSSAERRMFKEFPETMNWDDDYVKVFTHCIAEWEDKKTKEVKIVKE